MTLVPLGTGEEKKLEGFRGVKWLSFSTQEFNWGLQDVHDIWEGSDSKRSEGKKVTVIVETTRRLSGSSVYMIEM